MKFETFLLFLLGWSLGANSVRVSDKIYLHLNDNNQCFRLLNGTHQIGCQSSQHGDSGVVMAITDNQSLGWIIEDTPKYGRYIALIDKQQFVNSSIAEAVRTSSNVVGVVVTWRNDTSVQSWSPDYTCPNQNSGLYTDSETLSCHWNPAGSAYWFQNWPKPVFLLTNDTEIDLVEMCYKKYNEPGDTFRLYPFCGISLQFFQSAAENSETCLRRNHLFDGFTSDVTLCDPVGKYNYFVSIPTTNHTNDSLKYENGSVLVVATRIDSFTMFSEMSPGAESALSSIISLLSIVKALGEVKSDFELAAHNAKKFLLFSFFNGESLDYTGSTRTVWDIKNGTFPHYIDPEKFWEPDLLKMDHLGFFLELNQLALTSSGNKFQYFSHVDGKSFEESEEKVNDFLSKITDPNIDLKPATDDRKSEKLPPASLQKFLMEKRSIPAVLISDFQSEFKNKFYNSIADNSKNLENSPVDALTSLSNGILQAVISWVGGENVETLKNLKIDKKFVESLYQCLIVSKDLNCTLLNRIWTKNDDYKDLYADFYRAIPEARTYVGPDSSGNPATPTAQAIKHIVAWYLGDKYENLTQEECSNKNDKFIVDGKKDQIHSFILMKDLDGVDNRNVCVVSGLLMTDAKSPAFLDSVSGGYDWKSGKYPTWTESQWAGSDMRIFLISDPNWDRLVLAIGLIFFVLSFLVVYGIHYRSDVLFEPHAGSLADNGRPLTEDT